MTNLKGGGWPSGAWAPKTALTIFPEETALTANRTIKRFKAAPKQGGGPGPFPSPRAQKSPQWI